MRSNNPSKTFSASRPINMSKGQIQQRAEGQEGRDTASTSSHRSCRTPGPSEAVATPAFASPKIRDLSAARLERKQKIAQPATSLSSDTLLTAVKVQKVASDWFAMKLHFKNSDSVNASMVSLNESDISSSAVHLVSVLKASSVSAPKPTFNRSLSVAGSKRMLFKRKASSPPRAATPVQGSNLLSKLIKCSGNLTSRPAGPRELKPPPRPRQVIEVSLFSSQIASSAAASSKKEKRKPRIIEVSMTKS